MGDKFLIALNVVVMFGLVWWMIKNPPRDFIDYLQYMLMFFMEAFILAFTIAF